MYYDEETGGSRLSFAVGVLFGAVLGVTVALLAAPQSGRRTRRRITSVLADARDAAGERWLDIGDDVRMAVRGRRRRHARE